VAGDIRKEMTKRGGFGSSSLLSVSLQVKLKYWIGGKCDT